MSAYACRLPFSLYPLIAEARRRARQRRVLFTAVVALVAGGGAGAVLSIRSSDSSYVPTRPARAAVGASVTGFHQQTRLVWGGHIPRPHFGIVVFLRNGSGQTVTVGGVRAVLRAHLPLRQTGTRFGLYAPEVCPPGSFCSINSALGGPKAARPFGAHPFSPLRIPPGHTAEGQVNFRISSCTGRELREAVSLLNLIVAYRLPDGTQIHQLVPLKAGTPAAGVVSSAREASGWTGALPDEQLVGPVGEITTTACRP